MFCNIFDAVKVFLISKIAPQTYKRQVKAGSFSRPNVLNRPIIEVWNASISSQNNPQSCHLYELMSPWGFTFRQNISEMEVGRHLCENSFSSRLISNSRSNDHRHVRDKFCGQKVPRTLESFKRFSTNLETLTLFTNHIDVKFQNTCTPISMALNWKVS